MASILKASRGKGYYSKHLLAESVLAFYYKNKLWPQGLDEKLPSKQEWPMKMGEGQGGSVSPPSQTLLNKQEEVVKLDSGGDSWMCGSLVAVCDVFWLFPRT